MVATGKSMRQIDFDETNCCLRIRRAKERKGNRKEKNINTKRKPRGKKVNKMNQCESNNKNQSSEKMKPTIVSVCLLRLC